ncbi:lasso peptide biosynthesis B2 protein [Sphingomonas sp. So64.6b]|uniref:lasso peptide biosynthesis B2 protein n=1 Tax=Sphingomonas sp. So64.6b TaxID=2997354 RepID=UPI0015FF877A|nr:lasso peptide biosynthesis B2 protein [Sphingomonas sp. So64.6b]QNA83754.1 lasso peptide biosynthesis B2 protein [Sphingomonas sp. So64.6b]
MGFALRPGLSFARVGDRLLFLDIRHDRYFCLSPSAEAGFVRLIAGDDLSATDLGAVERWRADGLLVDIESAAMPQPCRPPPVTATSLDSDDTATPWKVATALSALVRSRIALKIAGLGRVLHNLEQRKASDVRPRPKADLLATATAFHQASLLASPLDQCLVRSLAIARRLAMVGFRPDLVIGVKLQPFAAHCWVQYETLLLNDRADMVRDFTPILVV